MSRLECLKNTEARRLKTRRAVATSSFVIRASLDIRESVIRHSPSLLFVYLSLVAGSCLAAEPLVRREFREPHMGTQFRIVLYTADESTANAASRAAFDRIARLDAMLSDYRDDSELMRLCQQAGGPAVPVSDELFRVLAASQSLAKRTDGAFDVTVGPVVRLWRRARRLHQLPDPNRLAEARALVGHELIRLEVQKGVGYRCAKHPAVRSGNDTRPLFEPSVQLLKPGMRLDLGGIAKGFAADEAIAVLERHGVSRALVAAGGDIVVSDPPPGECGWIIAIASPDPDRKNPNSGPPAPNPLLLLHNAAVSTSGDTEQFVEIAGKRYSHIVDPRTGIGLTDRLQVTVIAPTGTASDSLATAVSVLGPDSGLRLIDSIPGTAALIVRVGEQGHEHRESRLFRNLQQAKPK